MNDRGAPRGSAPPPRDASPDRDEAPPLGSWARLYALVIGVLLTDIVLLALLTRSMR